MGVQVWSSSPFLCRADKRARPIPRTRPQAIFKAKQQSTYYNLSDLSPIAGPDIARSSLSFCIPELRWMPLICPKDIPSARFVGTGFPDEGHGDMASHL